jgi:RNA polymerase-binding transcription factor DksA
MNTVNPNFLRAQLIKRRAEMALTLSHVAREQQDVEAKAASMDHSARASRLLLLRDLNEWYAHEISQVDLELQRAGDAIPGSCIACGAPIATATRLPAGRADLCADCQSYQRQL